MPMPRPLDRAIVLSLPVLVLVAGWSLGVLGLVWDMPYGDDPGPVVFVLAGVVGSWPAILLHEAGHALVAARRLRTPVRVSVGHHGARLQLETARLSAAFHPLDVVSGGSVELDGAEMTVDDVIAISLGGPAASLLGALAGLPLVYAMDASGFVQCVAWAFAWFSAIGVLNLLPFRYTMRRGEPQRASDGRQLMDALWVRWSLR